MQLTDLPNEVLDDIFHDIHSLINVPPEIRFHWYKHLKCSVVLRILQSTEMKRIKTNELCYYINFDSKGPQVKNKSVLLFNFEDVLPNINGLTVYVLPYAQVWPGSEMCISFWRSYLFTFPFCVDSWNHFNGNELRLSDVSSLKPAWPFLSDLHHGIIQSLIEENNLRDYARSIFKEMRNVYLHLSVDSLMRISKFEQDINPTCLNIKILPDDPQTIIRKLCGRKFSNLEEFSLEYMGPNSHVDVEAILSIFDIDKIKRLSLHIALLNVVELIWRLKSRRHESFTLTTSVLSYGKTGSCTSSNIEASLKGKFNKFVVYTMDEPSSVPQPRVSQTWYVLGQYQQRKIHRSYY
ncbi:hypothetical protein I9W82_001563 [Candida metapsilosis]|uniref:Uncharacterized protein n=1 Tax=Candida metapsilosis TaxID=273372 RepID=A0A8H7ZD77_9ASCO|nr:hypothetical protein I9W82_001563 [Candida metapsilosis]